MSTRRSTRLANGQKKTEEDSTTQKAPTRSKAQKTSNKKEAGPSSRKEEDAFKYLLSDNAYNLAYPKIEAGYGEKDWSSEERRKPLPKEESGQMKKNASNERGYSSKDLTPFEVLLCAVLMSKPLSHRLGLRTISTLFSPPFGLNTPKALEEAGKEGRREAMYEARTQHKDKTASQLGDLVEGLRGICKSEEDVISLKAVCDVCKKANTQEEAIEEVKSFLTANVKGLGPTGVEIFLRRIQSHDEWQAVYPFIDERAANTAHQLGLTSTADAKSAAKELQKSLGKDASPTTFVRLIDVLVGLGLEKKVEEVKSILS
ncbi:uncharacterized protein FA14DRAFT_32065 [Meira miltonrushii]|uniref:Uncharacterized protein n=1 Tax=Meira miltonrushii TaxID=1280837 RepID=A0A316VF27_9BASI|nr:uncharacterized protein FA14DRAFT_32065 [Meira miltonrushii]PWN34611.1 hypothetical protein FA14DRAFT_32065 [Meira miltonrushii]